MWTEIQWVEGPWPGKLAVSARPRGGDWLEDEIANWRQQGVGTILSLLTPEEEKDLALRDENAQARSQQIRFISLPIPDRRVPNSESELTAILEKLDTDLSSGKNVLVHCRQGIGRSGLVASCLLVTKGFDSEAAVKRVSIARGVAVPETAEQRRWIDHYAAIFASAK